MSWCPELTPYAKDYEFCEGELIFSLLIFTYYSALFFTNLGNDLLF